MAFRGMVWNRAMGPRDMLAVAHWMVAAHN
jgi:hypothetical protein